MEHWINFHETHCYSAKEQEFNDWYDHIHLPDVIDTPGYVLATRYKINEFKKGRGKYLAIYEIESDDINETIRSHRERKAEEVRRGKASRLYELVWGLTLYQQIYRYPPE